MVTPSLFLKDSGIRFEDKRYDKDATWPGVLDSLKERGITRTGKVPVLEYKGVILTQVRTSDTLRLNWPLT